MKHSEKLWSIVVTDEKGQRFLPILGGIVTTKTRAQAEKVLKEWRAVRCAYTPDAKIVRVKVSAQ